MYQAKSRMSLTPSEIKREAGCQDGAWLMFNQFVCLRVFLGLIGAHEDAQTVRLYVVVCLTEVSLGGDATL